MPVADGLNAAVNMYVVYVTFTCVDHAWVRVKPGWKHKTTEGWDTKNQEIPGGVQIHILQKKQKQHTMKYEHDDDPLVCIYLDEFTLTCNFKIMKWKMK